MFTTTKESLAAEWRLFTFPFPYPLKNNFPLYDLHCVTTLRIQIRKKSNFSPLPRNLGFVWFLQTSALKIFTWFMESKDWSSCGYFNPDFSPGKPVSLQIWTPPDLDPPPGQMRERICTPRSKSASGFVLPPVRTGSQMYPPGPNPLVDRYSPRSKLACGYVPPPPQQNCLKTH